MPTKVLAVDDSTMLRREVRRALSTTEFATLEAEDGAGGLSLLRDHPDTAVVVCDVNMPRMNGLDFLALMREDARFRVVPVIMLATEAQMDLIGRARVLGARGWLEKPFNAELLRATVRRLALLAAA